MNAVCETEQKSATELCNWLNDGTTPDDLQLETTRPWAQTFRVHGKGNERFLKVLPSVQTGAVAAMPCLSRLFPDVVPGVVAVDDARGLVLLEHHGGVDMDRTPTIQQKQNILMTYAKMQATAASTQSLLSLLPQIKTVDLVPGLLRFLDPKSDGTTASGPASAKDFLDTDRCQYYLELFQARAEKLSELIAISGNLPLTVNHCDLRPSNAACRENGDVIIYDWDEAAAGPAGMSLHHFFSGCSTPGEMLLDPASAMLPERANARALLGGYLRSLVTNGYADKALLNQCLPGSICAGVIHYLLSYGKFVPEAELYRDNVRAILRRRLNDLLKLGDILHLSSREQTLRIVEDYEKRDREDHACRVLARSVERDPSHSADLEKLSIMLSESKDHDEVKSTWRRLLDRHPECGAIHRHYGFRMLEQLEFNTAGYHLTKAVQLGETDDEIAQALDDAREFRRTCRAAEKSGEIPTIRVSADEQFRGTMKKARRRLAVSLFRKYGTLIIENAFSESLVEEMHKEYLSRYERYFVEEKHADALRVGNKRYMVTVEVEGVFNSPNVYANPHVAPIIAEILGENMIMGGFVSVCSLPGSENMRVHKDHPALFPESDKPDGLPSFAVTAVVPMLGFNPLAGTTRVVKGSHLCSSGKADKMESQDPTAPRGSCLLMDYRLTHQGRANRSDQVRPILTMIYHRPWFRDIVNYGKQDPVRMSEEAFAQVPGKFQSLFAWARPDLRSGEVPEKG